MSLRPPAPRAGASPIPPRPQKNWSIHRDVRPALCLTKTVRRFLRVGCVNWSKRKDSHLRSPRGRRVYSALHLLLFASLPRGHPLGSPTRFAQGCAIFALRAPSTHGRMIGHGGRWSEAERRTSRCGARPRAKRVNCTRRRSVKPSYGGQAGTGNHAQRVLRPSCFLISPRRE